MEKTDLIRRMEDLAAHCEKNAVVTSSAFLTPSEQYEISSYFARAENRPILFGGAADSERKAAFFLPFYVEWEDFDPSEVIQAVRIQSFFGTPGHRDYMGAVLGLGIRREWIGDILVEDDICYVFCLSSVCRTLLEELDKVGRCGVKVTKIALSEVPIPERKVKKLSFTVKSLRLDAVCGDLFGLPRTSAAELIRLGAVSLNYTVCEKVDVSVKEGDIISIRGKGKGCVTAVGGKSRKDRLFIEAELYL